MYQEISLSKISLTKYVLSKSTKNKPQKYYENYRRHEKIYVHVGKIK